MSGVGEVVAAPQSADLVLAGAIRPSGGGATVVVMTRRHLNDQQWFVLSWVADGCPDGVLDEGDHGHKISARVPVEQRTDHRTPPQREMVSEAH